MNALTFSRLTLLGFIIALFLMCSCDKFLDPDFGPEPDLGSKCKITLNGIHVSYIPLISGGNGTNYIRFDFFQNRNKYTNIFLPVLDDIRQIGDQSQVPWVFSQLKNGDKENHQFNQININQTKFIINEIDTSTQVVKCNFEVWFAKVKSGIDNSDSYLPDTLHFVGVIDTLYFD